ncbi:MAG: hypothetical protein PVF22_04180 [Candidatus Aminicenantes bacterium]|jgi:hypothetical protein
MNDLQAKEEIQLIKEMIEKTKHTAADYWKLFFCWGLVGILGVTVMYMLVLFEKYEWIWINWIGFIGIGVIYTVLFVIRTEKKQRIKTYTYTSISHLSFACGISFLLCGFAFPLSGLYEYGLIPVLISVVAGIYAFALGGIIEWNLLKVCGVIWWLGSAGMIFIDPDYRAILFVPLLILGYLIPGFIFRSGIRKPKAANES